ncbi:LAMI_0F08196g1_1 [Lachancea mirantina]|uniref:RNA helicase n=1 Tax=Lachancea mirantina TaxID=1230905 RepID=A0A1G4K090_9SACH|nr:LAMI_0F08196g1_1 [Lachancea mirantina]
MEGVSSKEKQRLLQERRNKWKQKKAKAESQKQQVTNKTESVDRIEDGSVTKKAKLERFKRRKGEGEAWSGPENQRTRKRVTFEDSDDDDDDRNVKLFRPDQTQDIGADEVETNFAGEKVNAKRGEDSLDAFMRSMQNSRNESDNLVQFHNDSDSDEYHENGQEFENYGDGIQSQFKKNRKKKVRNLNFNSAQLEPFVRTFYTEPEEISAMTEEEVEDMRLSLDNVKIRGKNCPRPVFKWSHLGLTSDIMDLITKKLNFSSPTPIQAQAVPAIMSGQDVIGISKTGSGKTVSFLLPLLRQIRAARPLGHDETGPLGLILAPTRELAVQIHEEVQKFIGISHRERSICCTGGSEMKRQIHEIKKGVEIVVATPGRFIDLLTLNSGRLLDTKRITFVVMDEADRLFDLGFEPQVTEIMKTIRPDKQCVLFSATFPSKLRSFAMRVLNDPITITINSKSLINENIKQKVAIYNDDQEKFQGLLSILEGRENSIKERSDLEDVDDKTIIFVSSQQICDLIYFRLEERGITTYAIHAGKPYAERASSLEKFKKTRNGILLCTEVLSRGLNVPEVSLVVIYNAVKTFAQYVHTAGRTARGTKSGITVTLLLSDELNAAYILKKSFREEEIETHNEYTKFKLIEMGSKFENGMNSGKFRLGKGFGGKGLDHMEMVKEQKLVKEMQEMGPEQHNRRDTPATEGSDATAGGESTSVTLQYKFLQNRNPDNSVTYSAEVNVNDLPQLVRWETTKNTTLMSIKQETACSITNRGKYYADGQNPKTEKEEPKLYLLIEAPDEKDVRLAIELLQEKVKEASKKDLIRTVKSGKSYSIV